jgi:hypothetical protein
MFRKKDILTPNVIADRSKSWNNWHSNSIAKLEELNVEFSAKLAELLDENGKFAFATAEDVSELARIGFEIHFLARTSITAIEWSADDYQVLAKSRTFRFMTKLRDRFIK